MIDDIRIAIISYNAYRVNSAVRQIGVCRCVSKFPVIARPVRTLVVAIPRLEVNVSTIALQGGETLLFW